MHDQILQAVRVLAIAHAAPFQTIEHGAMPQNNGLSMYLGPGTVEQRHMDKGGIQQITVALNGKHQQLDVVLGAMSNIHTGLMATRDYPGGAGWRILNIETSTPPNYLDREDSGTRQWLYGSLLVAKVYFGGACNA